MYKKSGARVLSLFTHSITPRRTNLLFTPTIYRFYSVQNAGFTNPNSQKAKLIAALEERKKANLPTLTKVRTENKWDELQWEVVELEGVKTNLKIDAIKIEEGNEKIKEQIKEIENSAGHPLPTDYLAFISKYEDVEVRFPTHYWIHEEIGSPSEPLKFINLCDEVITPEDIVTQNSLSGSDKMKNWSEIPAVVIAQQCEVYILLVLEDFNELKRGMVCSVDLQRPDDEVRQIANSFTDFLCNMLTDEEEELHHASSAQQEPQQKKP